MLLPETVFPVKLIAVKSNVSAFAFTFFVFYVTPRVESLSYLTLSKPGQAHQKRTTRLPIIKRGVVPFWWTWAESNRRPTCLTLQLCPFKDYNNSLNQRFFLVALLAARSIGVGFLRDIIVSLISNIIYPAYAG